MTTATFEADSALLRELGERLVGQAHIALAELVKNAYDADATRCDVQIGDDEIAVVDDGHGMTEQEFLDHWMTIGTRHKEGNRGRSRHFGRSVTGSKGVGRLAAQFLAHKLEMATTSRDGQSSQLVVEVNWDDAIDAGKLTEAKAEYDLEPRTMTFAGFSPHGTRVRMKTLKQDWEPGAIRDLGRELWMIQSPIGSYGEVLNDNDDPDAFEVTLRSSIPRVEDEFDDQMQAALENHIAVIKGEITRRGTRAEAHVVISFRAGEQHSERFEMRPLVDQAKWEIRIFNLSGKQGRGIPVQEARNYFAKFGGVKVYDAGFRLPYYGVDQDWLGIELDHSHRKNRSALLPERLQVRRALNDLPTQGRLFGVVDINTGHEARTATDDQEENGDFLKIQVTRDRLVANGAYDELRRAVRWSLDYYATRQRLREQARAELERPVEAAGDTLTRIQSLVASVRSAHPGDDDLAALEDEFAGLTKTMAREKAADEATRALLAPLASAGMAALALEHETRKEIGRARDLLDALDAEVRDRGSSNAQRLVRSVRKWIERTDESRKLFQPLLDIEDREEVEALSAADVLKQVTDNVRPLIPGITVDVDVPARLFLPPATFAEWNSLFQNILLNAANATLDVRGPSALCTGGYAGRGSWIRIQDNGTGVDLANASNLFEPYARSVHISDERRELGLGGTGLGLTIVRMIATRRNAHVSFVPSEAPWNTTFRMTWRR